MTNRFSVPARAIAAVLALVAVTSAHGTAQDRRPHIYPSFEGWEPNADGTATLMFGYMAELRVGDTMVDIPIGPDNTMEPGIDRGQPSTFHARRQANVFRVVVPGNFKDKIVWTIRYAGDTQQATGSLNPIYALGNGDSEFTPVDPLNKAPIIALGPPQTIAVGATATIAATVKDDGLPRARATGRPRGVTVSWRKYRGPGPVTLTPATQPAANGAGETRAAFSVPGDYQIQAIASDGALNHTAVTTIVVK